jgi:inner membrane protein
MEFITDPGPWTWLILGLVLLGIEVATGTTYLLWLAIAAAAMAALTALLGDLSLPVQLIVYGAFALAATISGRKFFPPDERGTSHVSPPLNQPDSRLLGQSVVAVADFDHGAGRVKIGDTEWRAEAASDDPIGEGARLEVIAVDGATVKVRLL